MEDRLKKIEETEAAKLKGGPSFGPKPTWARWAPATLFTLLCQFSAAKQAVRPMRCGHQTIYQALEAHERRAALGPSRSHCSHQHTLHAATSCRRVPCAMHAALAPGGLAQDSCQLSLLATPPPPRHPACHDSVALTLDAGLGTAPSRQQQQQQQQNLQRFRRRPQPTARGSHRQPLAGAA